MIIRRINKLNKRNTQQRGKGFDFNATYKPTHFTDFKPKNESEKRKTVQVADFDNVPDDMETFMLKGGLYAVFEYKG